MISLRALCAVILLVSAASAKAPIKLIDKLTVTKNNLSVSINKHFKEKYLKSDFFVEYGEDINLELFDYSINSLPFIMNVISLVWISGEDYQVDEMDIEIFQSLERIKQVFKVMYPKTSWEGRLIPKKLVSHEPLPKTSERIALLFSGGLDSTVSSFYHRDTPQLLITAWGQSCLPLDEPELWQEIQKRIIDFGKRYGHENAFLKSNFYYFLDFAKLKDLSPEIVAWRIDTIEDIGWAGLIAPILFTKGIPSLFIGASETWQATSGSAMNPYIDGNIRFAGINVHHDLFSMTRFDKVTYLVDLCNRGIVNKPQLIICQKPGGIITCSSCEKCCLTIALLLGAHANPQDYGFPFDSEKSSLKIQKKILKLDSFDPINLLQYQELQKHVQRKPNKHLTWITDIDFSQKEVGYVKPGTHYLKWSDLDVLFPHIRAEAN